MESPMSAHNVFRSCQKAVEQMRGRERFRVEGSMARSMTSPAGVYLDPTKPRLYAAMPLHIQYCSAWGSVASGKRIVMLREWRRQNCKTSVAITVQGERMVYPHHSSLFIQRITLNPLTKTTTKP